MFIFLVSGEIGLESFGKFPPREQNTPPAAFAFQPDIRTQTRNRPFVRAAWMLFAQAQMVVDTEVRKHGQYEHYK